VKAESEAAEVTAFDRVAEQTRWSCSRGRAGRCGCWLTNMGAAALDGQGGTGAVRGGRASRVSRLVARSRMPFPQK
jgi:hypothetical protein